jgi:hypothetical protein
MSETRAAEDLAAMRVSYEREALDEPGLAATWHEQLLRWLGEAIRAGLAEPNAMVLATADGDGRPSSRAHPGAAAVGRLADPARDRGVLAGTAEPDA